MQAPSTRRRGDAEVFYMENMENMELLFLKISMNSMISLLKKNSSASPRLCVEGAFVAK
jgi:hypothetical protein